MVGDDIHRTAKILVDAGTVASFDDAYAMLRSFVLQVDVGPDLADDPAAGAALLTTVNSAARAFLGGVRICLAADPVLPTGWGVGLTASAAVARHGGELVDHLDPDIPTLTIGTNPASTGDPVLHLTWRGWAGAVVERPDRLLDGANGNELAGVAAAALGVSEMFQRQTGNVVAGRRDVGLSIWRPDLDWSSPDAIGPPLRYLPAAVWLLGLGHLGQAYAWTLGLLPYATPHDVRVGLVDYDVVVPGNAATQMLVRPGDIGRLKTRVVSDALESLGFDTRIVERAFDQHFHPVSHGDPRRDEPLIALAGFDVVEPRRQLGQGRFAHVVDGALGGGTDYLGIDVHTFPAAGEPSAVFASAKPRLHLALGAAYEAEIERQIAAGEDETAARCGIVDVAGITVGAAFVGTLASTMVIGDLLRLLHEGGASFSIISVDLRAPQANRAVQSTGREPIAPSFTMARS
ncbi:MAG: UBA/ThiF-type binding fold containing protein [Mycobacterium sp.]|nr:UBA/ThiF-type binding fold containing protein [Mycobacterium sp.]